VRKRETQHLEEMQSTNSVLQTKLTNNQQTKKLTHAATEERFRVRKSSANEDRRGFGFLNY